MFSLNKTSLLTPFLIRLTEKQQLRNKNNCKIHELFRLLSFGHQLKLLCASCSAGDYPSLLGRRTWNLITKLLFSGAAVLFCYILRSENYIMVWCGDKETWSEVRILGPVGPGGSGSGSDSGASRITSSSHPTQRTHNKRDSFRGQPTFAGMQSLTRSENLFWLVLLQSPEQKVRNFLK